MTRNNTAKRRMTEQSTRIRRPWYTTLAPRADSTDAYKSVYEAFIAIDWVATTLGKLEDWPTSLCSVVSLVLSTRSEPMALYIGPNHYMVYNEAAIQIYMDKHPRVMGLPFIEAWADLDLLDLAVQQIAQVEQSGCAIVSPVTPFRMRRHAGQEEELLFSCEWGPIMDEYGEFTSTLIRFKDETPMIRDEERRNFMTTLQERVISATTYEDLYHTYLSVLSQTDPAPVEFFFLYEYNDDAEARPGAILSFTSLDSVVSADKIHASFENYLSRSSQEWFEINIDNATSVNAFIRPIIISNDSSTPDYFVYIGIKALQTFNDASKQFVRSLGSTLQSAFGVITSSTILNQSETRFQEMLLNAPVGFNVEDELTRLPAFVNDTWRNMLDFHLPLSAIDANTDFGALCHPTMRESFMAEYVLISRSRHLTNFDLRLARPYVKAGLEGHPEDNIWVRISTAWLPGTLEARSTILWTLVDISEHKRLERLASEELLRAVELQILTSEKQIERERADAAERNAAKFLEHLDFSSHEIRNPLHAILNAAELSRSALEGSEKEPVITHEVLEHLESIVVCARHMNRIVDDTLSYSQLDHGSLQVALLPCKLHETIKNVILMFKAELSANSLHLKSTLPDIGLILTDASRFSQILINMLTNAIKFTQHDGTGEIEVSLQCEDVEGANQVKISCFVKDNGSGMDPATLDCLFQRFTQANAKTHVQYGGSGLGLYISKRLTQVLGGDITATSKLGHGTTLGFYFIATKVDQPDRVASEALVIEHKSEIRSHVDSDRSKLDDPGRQQTLLIVEDNLLNQKLMKKLLEKSYKILTANNGLECVNICQSELGSTIDLVLCDCEMPIMTGYEAVAQVKAWLLSLERRSIPFLAVSANSRPEQVQHMLDSGMDDTLRKPVERAELYSAVERMLSDHRLVCK